MGITTLDKAEVLAGLFRVWQDIDELAAGLTVAQWQAATALPGWSVHDVVAHIIGVEAMLQGEATPQTDIDVSTLDHVRNDIGAMNESWVRALRSVEPAELLSQLRTVTAQRREALSAMSDDDWNAVTDTPAGPDSYGRFMRIRIFDCWMHEHDIRDAVELPVDDTAHSLPARLALDEITAAMGRVVGKLGKAPDGSRVRIALTGPLARRIDVAVQGGRGQVVPDFADAQPTAVIEVDGLLFTRLAGGRTDAARPKPTIVFGGDEAVGRRIVEHLNYVI